QVPELAVEAVIAVVGDFQQSVFDAKGIREILPEGVAFDLWRPAVEISSVEKLDPLSRRRVASTGGRVTVECNRTERNCDAQRFHDKAPAEPEVATSLDRFGSDGTARREAASSKGNGPAD